MKKFNKKTLAGLLVLGSIASSAAVFASSDISANFKNDFKAWAEKKVEIRKGTAEGKIQERVEIQKAKIAKEQEEILAGLEALMSEELKAGNDITALLEAYQVALDEAYEAATVQGKAEFEKYFADKQTELEKFAAAQLENTKAAITAKKEAMMKQLTNEIGEKAKLSKETLVKDIENTRKLYEGEMSTVRKAGQEEVLAYFDAEMAEVFTTVEALDVEAQQAIKDHTTKLVEDAKQELHQVAGTVGK